MAESIAGSRLNKGDIVLVQAGDLVPADIKLLEATQLQVDEWELTGELTSVEKRVNEETDYLYRGSRIIKGWGKGVVIGTGAETEYGTVLKQSWEQRKREWPPLTRRRYWVLLLVFLPPCVTILIRRDNTVLALLICLSVTVAVVLLQNHELLKYLLTSRELRKLRAHGLIIRDETCLETASRLDTLCLDKTGVLTTLKIEVASIHFADDMLRTTYSLPDDERGSLAGVACALCNDVFFLERKNEADRIDAALIAFARQHGFDITELADEYVRIFDKAFSSEDRYMIAGFEHGNGRVSFAKGDPEVVLRMCTSYLTASGTSRRIDADSHSTLRTVLSSAQQEGDIVLALAYSPSFELPSRQYVLLCFIRLRNPLKPQVPEWIRSMVAWKIRPIMLTGDRAETALTIAREAGIGRDSAHLITGKELTRMPLQEVARQAAYVSVFARLLPSQKGLVVRLLQRQAHCVAMIGDGANDTVALRVADLGVSFAELASPLAKNVARVLVRNLDDVLALVAGAKRIERRFRRLRVFQILMLIAMALALYGWAWGSWRR